MDIFYFVIDRNPLLLRFCSEHAPYVWYCARYNVPQAPLQRECHILDSMLKQRFVKLFNVDVPSIFKHAHESWCLFD